ncbi:hypothetical protein, partial [Variovorax sp. SCN 67-20]|uniref:hypothetical protein n=1 Tax=Variovorax sp. SCN 67-20 TaxID=1660153 RepID=UPI0025EAAFF5
MVLVSRGRVAGAGRCAAARGLGIVPLLRFELSSFALSTLIWEFVFPGPGLGPAADLLFFASPKKRRQKKGDPAVCVP